MKHIPQSFNNPDYPEWTALQNALKGQVEEPQGVDPAKLLALLQIHKLTAWYYTQIAKPHFPKDHPLTLALKDAFSRHQQKALLQLAERITLTQKLSDQGVDALHIKGAVLSIQLYQDPTVRMSGDIDILIAPENFLKADQILMQLGYRRESPENDILQNNLPLFQKYMKDAIYWHPEKKIMLELHWRLTTSPFWMNPKFQSFWQERVKVSYSGFELATLSHTHHFLYLCLHAARHSFSRLQWLQDIAELTKQGTFFDAHSQSVAQQFHLKPALETTQALLKLFSMPYDKTLKCSKASQHHAQKIYQHLMRYPEQDMANLKYKRLCIFVQELRLLRLHPKKTLLPHLHFHIEAYVFNKTEHKNRLMKNPLLAYWLFAWYLIAKK